MRAGIAALIAATSLWSQEAVVDRSADRAQIVQRAVSVRSRFTQFQSPATATYGIASLGAVVCAVDRDAGAGLFREAIIGLNALREAEFVDSAAVLPLMSFSALVRYTVGAAIKCDPSLGMHLTTDRVRERMQHEREQANSNLAVARSMIRNRPDRAAQLLAGAISAGEPGQLDLATAVKALSELREPAPDLSDDLFGEVLAFAERNGAAPPDLLSEIGKYLFTAERLKDKPDPEQAESVVSIGSSRIPDFTFTRYSTNPESAAAYITAVVRMAESAGARGLDPLLAYALVHQMLPVSRRVAQQHIEVLERVDVELGTAAGPQAGQVAAMFSTSELQPANDEDLDPARRRDRLVQRFSAEWLGGRVDAAEQIRLRVDDQVVRSQLDGLMRWLRTVQAIQGKDSGAALAQIGNFPPGARRVLLSISAATKSADRTSAYEMFKMAWRETEPMPAEQRACLLFAIAAGMLNGGFEDGHTVAAQGISALNDALVRPRRARFNPNLRKAYDPQRDPAFESALMLRAGRTIYEAVDTGRARFNFPLQAPEAVAHEPATFLRAIKFAEWDRFESALASLRDETRLARALVAIWELRLKRLASEAR